MPTSLALDNKGLTIDTIARATLVAVENNLVMGNLVDKEFTSEFHNRVNGYKVGDTISIERPNRFYVGRGRVVQETQQLEEGKAKITVDTQSHMKWEYSSFEMTMRIDAYAEKHLKPIGQAFAQDVDSELMGMYADVYNVVGTPGDDLANFTDVSRLDVRLTEGAVPAGMWALVIDPQTRAVLAGDQTRLLNAKMVESAYRRSYVGMISKLKTHETQNTSLHETGDFGGTVLLDGNGHEKTWADVRDKEFQELPLKGFAPNARLKRGDVFTIAGVHAVNPVPGQKANGTVQKKKMPYLQQFVIKEDVQADGSGKAVARIRPFIIVDGAQRTVSDAPVDGAAITFVGEPQSAYEQYMAFHKKAFALCIVPLVKPKGAAEVSRVSRKGLTLRVTRGYDQDNDVEGFRADILFGCQCIRPEFAVRHFGRKLV